MAESESSESNAEFVVTCPRCKRKVKVKESEAEKTMAVKCPCGEKIELAKSLS